MADVNDLIEDSPKRLSRRNVLVGTAWAVPVVMGVGATPAMAASSYVSSSATVKVRGSKLMLTVNVLGWKTADHVVLTSVTRATGSWTWSTAPVIGGTGYKLTSNATTFEVGNLKDKAAEPPNSPVAGTVNFTVTIKGAQVAESAPFAW